jgi:hypothetical protein
VLPRKLRCRATVHSLGRCNAAYYAPHVTADVVDRIYVSSLRVDEHDTRPLMDGVPHLQLPRLHTASRTRRRATLILIGGDAVRDDC